MNDLISVVIPIYNVEKFLHICVESILQQTYKNLQIILVDDGSSDDCPKICDDYVKKDCRIQVIHKKNGGLSDARNVGIQCAKGKFLTLIDSDDCVSPDYIEYLYNLISSVNGDMSVCQYNKIDENGILYREKIERIKTVFSFENRQMAMKSFFIEHSIGEEAWGKLYRRVLFKNIKYPYGRYHEDVFTTHLLIDKCQKIIVGKAKKYYYRQRHDSIMNQSFSEKHLDLVIGNIERREFIKKKYPNLVKFANAGIIYAANTCCLRIIFSKVPLDSCMEYIKFLQKQYRLYVGCYLKDRRNSLSKVFSAMAYMNLKILIQICRKLYYLKRLLKE